MRYIMKGGVWKNSQDQILKAAIMKYGLNQWSRISSLLPRKSAKQCKQRWYQWLDPSIKKTQWTRAQDQKLLQLSRVFPSQWRTIGPFVGRTPTQCYQRYEKLLDLAQGKTGKQSQDLKKLRPGQIDPNPETKPARLDPIDMDQDEKQMLAQVRVRLANTKGKKAKRKERQKIIEQARRLAQLQKVRQLQMAGVDNIPTAKQIKRMKQRKDIDYNKAIPFKRDVPEFKYALEEGQTPKNLSFAQTITLQTLEGKRRDVEEELQRKLDKRRMKKFKQRDLKSALMLKNDFEKPSAFPIQMPQPQIGEKDLQNMKKYNITTPLNTILGSQSRYGMTPENKIMLAAKVNLSLNHQSMDSPIVDDLMGIQGLNYLKRMQKGNDERSQMRSIDRVISERMKTPSAGDWEESTNIKLKSLFGKMKKPQNMVQFQIPEQQEEQQERVIMDAEQLQKLQIQRQQIQEQELIKIRSQVIKRNLPRPSNIPHIKTFVDNQLKILLKKETIKKQVNQLIAKQMLSLIYSDAIDYPLQVTNFPDSEIPYKVQITFEQFSAAKSLVLQQASIIDQRPTKEDYNRAKRQIKFNFLKNQVQLTTQLSEIELKNQKVEIYKLNVQSYKQQIKRCDNHEKKTKKLMAGYQRLVKNKTFELNTMQQQLKRLQKERMAMECRQDQQRQSMKSRLQALQAYYKQVYCSI